MSLTEEKLKQLLTSTGSFMNHVHWVQQDFGVKPIKKHHLSCINYIDLQEYRDEFCSELVNTIPEWIYSSRKFDKILADMIENEGRSKSNANSALITETRKKFRTSATDDLIIQGQFGELILFNLLQVFFQAVPLIRKMPLTTSANMERYGADAIHYNYFSGKHIIYIGEAKAYTSKYQFSTAFGAAVESILENFQNHRRELGLYTYDDFLDDDLVPIAKNYKNGKLNPVEIHLVSIIIYHETTALARLKESEIKAKILEIVQSKAAKIEEKIYDKIDPGILPRLNYIFFPIWEMDLLLKRFQSLIAV